MERRQKIRYVIADAINYVLNPGSDSELSELEDDDIDDFKPEDEMINENLKKQNCFEDLDVEGDSKSTQKAERVSFEIIKTATDNLGDHDTNEEVKEHENNERNESTMATDTNKSHTFRWSSRKPPVFDSTFTGGDFSLPPENFDELTPLWYFQQFWDDDMTNHLADQTNLYSVQKTGASVATTNDEIEKLLGMEMKMGVVKMPRYDSYWQAETRYGPVADVMSKNRYKKLRKFLHANDNSLKDHPGNKDNKMFKVSPILDKLRRNCQQLEQEEYQSIDEQIVPAKTKYSGIRQHNPRKPHKWGFKNFVRAGQSGMIYDFFFYTGAKSTGAEKNTAKGIVMKLCENVPKSCNYKVFFDNWFSTLDLCLELKANGILTAATIRENRLAGCTLKAEKELKKEGRGSFTYQTDQNTALTVIRWYDNRCVQLVSTYLGVEASETVQRWDSKTRSHVPITCPEMVIQYNKSMGGVDLADMLIALYRCKVKTKRWYLALIFHALDIAKVNAWLLYRRFCSQLGISNRKQMSLLTFTSRLADALIKSNKPSSVPRSVGRLAKRSLSLDNQQTKS